MANVRDLEERTFQFAKMVTLFTKTLPRNFSKQEYVKQLVRSSGSIGANYIEANEALSKKDFAMRIRISRKEAKESSYWLRLIIETNGNEFKSGGMDLMRESEELKKILSAILLKST
jgi:four helix bundle protein